MVTDIGRELRVDLVQHVLAVEQRPHLADRLVADPGHDAADVLHDGIGGAPLVPPVLLHFRQLVADGIDLAVLHARHDVAGRSLVLHVVDAGPNVDDGLEHRMGSDVGDALALDEDGAAVAERFAVLFPGPDHAGSSPSVVHIDRAMTVTMAPDAPTSRFRSLASGSEAGV